MPTKNADVIMDEKKVNRAITRIAHEILEHNTDTSSLVIIGVITRGAFLAKRLAKIIKELEGIDIPVGLMDIGLYRDDIHSNSDQPIVQQTDILFSVVDKNVILVDDVLFTGRTVRAALNQIVDFGRPSTIQLAVLIDRGHRELPIKADYVGVNIPTSKDDQVLLHVKEKEKSDKVSLIKGQKKKAAKKKTSAQKTKGGKK